MINYIKVKIRKSIEGHKLEDPEVLQSVNSIFRRKRGYVFRMPKKGSKVISLMSGGLDTTVVTALLLDKYQFEVYPIHFIRTLPAANPKSMARSVDFFSDLFKKKYGSRFHDVIKLPLQFPAKKTETAILSVGQVILNNKTGQRKGIPFQPSAFAHEIVNYIYTLNLKEQKAIRTIFAATLVSNTNWFAYETLTAYRVLNLEVCTMLSDFSWQITAFPIERELGWCMDKQDLIREGIRLNLPLEHTFTCQKDFRYQCGRCIVCIQRRIGFKEAGINDKTIYESSRTDTIGKLKRKYFFLGKILKKL